MNFEEKVQSMTIKEIVLAMVHGLEHKHVEVMMGTYGVAVDGICYGCAATNTICEIQGSCFDALYISSTDNRAAFLDVSPLFLDSFERAINYLRLGNLRTYNQWIEDVNGARFPLAIVDTYLPRLSNNNYMELLSEYKEFAETL